MDKIINEIKMILNKNIVSIVEFGSEEKRNNYLIILKKLDFSVLNKIKPVMIKQRKQKLPVPLFFTEEELYDASDVFPLEFLDIKEPHKTIFGKDVINKITFDKRHIRNQIEFELRSKLIHLRENYIWVKDDNELRGLLSSAVPSLMPLFYGLLFLKDTRPSHRLGNLFRQVAKEYKVDLSILLEINDLDKCKGKELHNKVKELMKLLEEMIKIVDKIIVKIKIKNK